MCAMRGIAGQRGGEGVQRKWGMKDGGGGGKIREGGTDEREYKSKDNKTSKEREEKDRRGSTRWTAGPGSWGSSSGSGRAVNVILSSRRLQMRQPKLYSNLTFQKHGLIQVPLLSLFCFPTPPVTFFPPLPFSICSLLSPLLFLSHFLSS